MGKVLPPQRVHIDQFFHNSKRAVIQIREFQAGTKVEKTRHQGQEVSKLHKSSDDDDNTYSHSSLSDLGTIQTYDQFSSAGSPLSQSLSRYHSWLIFITQSIHNDKGYIFCS